MVSRRCCATSSTTLVEEGRSRLETVTCALLHLGFEVRSPATSTNGVSCWRGCPTRPPGRRRPPWPGRPGRRGRRGRRRRGRAPRSACRSRRRRLPVLERALEHVALDAAEEVAGDGLHEVRPDLVVQTSRTSVPGLARSRRRPPQRVGLPHHRAVGLPAGVDLADLVGVPAAERVRRVDRVVATVLVGHRAVLGVGVHLDLGPVDRQLQVVRADPVAVRVGVGERAAEQHLVGPEPDARHQGATARTRPARSGRRSSPGCG